MTNKFMKDQKKLQSRERERERERERTFSDDPATSSTAETSVAAPLAWCHIHPSCNGSTSSVSTGISTFN